MNNQQALLEQRKQLAAKLVVRWQTLKNATPPTMYDNLKKRFKTITGYSNEGFFKIDAAIEALDQAVKDNDINKINKQLENFTNKELQGEIYHSNVGNYNKMEKPLDSGNNITDEEADQIEALRDIAILSCVLQKEHENNIKMNLEQFHQFTKGKPKFQLMKKEPNDEEIKQLHYRNIFPIYTKKGNGKNYAIMPANNGETVEIEMTAWLQQSKTTKHKHLTDIKNIPEWIDSQNSAEDHYVHINTKEDLGIV
ncbi:MAG: hypothetical protein GY821_03520 [Gammaproteobacteria bacterium]|nr:hypothetical protein [Gammaproteobacteria bacterium]